jgi:phage shock protein A
MAETKTVSRDLDATRGKAEEWEDRVELAVRKERDDLAREALLQKRGFLARAEALERERAESEDIVRKYKEDIDRLEDKLASAREKHRTLAQRHTRAVKSRKARQTIRKADTHDAFVRFERFEQRIDRMEAAADLVDYRRRPSLQEEFDALERDDDLEGELRDVKARIAGEKKDDGK